MQRQSAGIIQTHIGIIIAVIAVGIGGYFFVFHKNKVEQNKIPPRAETIPKDVPQSSLPPVAAIDESPRSGERAPALPDAKNISRAPIATRHTESPAVKPVQTQPPAQMPPQAPKQEILRTDSHEKTGTQIQPSAPPPSLSFRRAPEFPTAAELQNVPQCGSVIFSFAPVEVAKLIKISPLGNLAPPGHTLPTEHMFFHITAGGVSTETIPLYSPGEMHITLISSGRGFTQDPIDYTIWFTPCKDIIGYYNHVKELSPELEKVVTESQCAFPGESKDTRCNITMMARAGKGAQIGRVGRLQGNFDMGVIDLRKTHVFANPSRYGERSLHIQCPLDYFDQNTKTSLYLLLPRSDMQCGKIVQDILGTLKGNWFFGPARADMGTDWDKYLAFADDSENPEISVISAGGIFTTAGKWEFPPQKTGSINRAFEEVKSDGATYCYESQKMPGRVVVRVESATELLIEHQQASCAQQIAFTNPTRYAR